MINATEDAPSPPRSVCLQEADNLTRGDRLGTYGDPVENMQRIADIFNAWTGRDLTALEVSKVLIALKMARAQTAPLHKDSYVDAMAYFGIQYECALAAQPGPQETDK